VGGLRRRPQIRVGLWVWVLGNQEEFVWMFDRNRVRGVVDDPKLFFFNGRLRNPSPSIPNLPLLSLPDLFESGERTRLMSVILLLTGRNVHGARLKPDELI